MRRREFITLLGSAVAWPIAARAQQPDGMRRIGVLTTAPENDSESQARIGAFREGLAKLGWTEGREIRIDYRWAAGDQERARAYAAELVALKPDVIFAAPSAALAALRQTRNVPIVFAHDPVGEGWVASLARPGGNVTGFAQYEFAIAAKWMELLKQIAPNVTRVAVIYDPANPEWKQFVPVIEAAAPSVGMQASFSVVRNRADIERAIEELVRGPNGGLIPLPSPLMLVHRELIISLGRTYRLPNVYAYRHYPINGGLASYGIELVDLYRRAASYVDRILKGEKPGDLPIQQATKFELVINLKTAKALGIEIPILMQLLADGGDRVRRRAFITLLGGAAAWPLTALAQESERMRRIGILMPYPPTDVENRSRVDALKQELQRLGWTRGRDIEFDERWTTDNMDLVRANAANLVELRPDVIVASGGRVIPVLLQITRAVPIVVPGSVDPVGTGWVKSLARPGGNITGFTLMEFSMFGKLLDLLKQLAPGTVRVGLVFNPDNPSNLPFRREIETFAGPLGIEPVVFPIHGFADIDRAIVMMAEQPNTAVFFLPDVTLLAMAQQVVELVRQRRLPTIYTDLIYVRHGGLAFYGVDRADLYRRAAGYIDRILHGEKPGDLPFQQPTKYQFVINLKAATALGLEVPPALLASADEVIE